MQDKPTNQDTTQSDAPDDTQDKDRDAKHTRAGARPPEELHRMPDGNSRVAKESNPQRSSERPKQTAEVPYGTGQESEPPGGGGRESQKK